MEGEAEKMAALKRAYADIILNTARESAARILESERRAVRLQRALAASRDEALATLLRLKALMDSKIKEAETASLGQARRIQELEDQLSEAEDTVVSLREELNRVNNEFYKIKNNLEPLKEQNTYACTSSCNGICQDLKPTSDSSMCSLVGVGNIKHTSSQKSADQKFCFIETSRQSDPLKDLSASTKCVSNPDLPSIIMLSNETEPYRNGCTQRIRAFENSSLASRVPPFGHNDGQLFDSRNAPIVCNDKNPGNHCVSDTAKTMQEAKVPSDPALIVQQASSCGDHVKVFRRLSPRKQTAKSDHLRSVNHADPPEQELKDHEPSKDCGPRDAIIESDVSLVKKLVSEEPSSRKLNSHSATAVSCKRSEDKDIYLSASFSNRFPGLLRCKRTTATRQRHSDSHNEISHRTEHDFGYGTGVTNMILTGGTQNDAALEVEDVKLTADEIGGKSSEKSYTKDVLSADTNDEIAYESSEPPAQSGTDKFLKYTFRRKRKRGSSGNKVESNFPEKTASKRRSGEKQNALTEPQKPSLVTDLPRDNRRLLQVARQLISLSEKRW